MNMNATYPKTELIGSKYFVSMISVFLLIPAFMFYQLLANFHIIEPVFGGYFTFGMIITFPLNVILFASSYRFNKLLRVSVFPLFLFFCFVCKCNFDMVWTLWC